MWGHGTIGLIATLAYMMQIAPGQHRIETPVGAVSAILHESGEVTVNNVGSYRSAADVAWGGNWFFLVRDHQVGLTLNNVDQLTAFTWAIRNALRASGICGDDG